MGNIIVVLGYGKSTQAAIGVLHRQYDATICVYDEAQNGELDILNATQINTIDEVPSEQVLFCLKSPGIAYSKSYVQYFIERDIPVYTDVELFLRKTPGKVIAITGTNGKTTVTTLVGDVLKQSFEDVRVCGNIGIPIAEVCEDADENTIFVAELSSFQLKGTEQFKPDISVLLNVADAHLDYHETEIDYEQSKAKIFANQDGDDIVLYNGDDAVVCGLVESAKATCLSIGHRDTDEIKLEMEKITFQNADLMYDCIKVPGEHNKFNVAVAFAIGVMCGVDGLKIEQAIRQFGGVKHRLQYVDTVGENHDVYNDSKSTNEYAVKTALRAFDKSMVWICGGYDRGIPYTDIVEEDIKHVTHMVIYGMMQPQFVAIAEQWNIPFTCVETFDTVFEQAMKVALPNDVILFSPGAASFDFFQNFEQRGDTFLNLVKKYQDERMSL